MSDQFGLFAPPPAPSARRVAGPRLQSNARRHDVFLAIRPDAADAARLAAHAAAESARLGVGGQAVEAGRLHVSLFGLAEYASEFPAADVARWMAALDTVRIAPFEVAFDLASTFGGQGNPLVMRSREAAGVAGVRRLHEAVGIALADTGLRLGWSNDEPHMTVSYRGARIVDSAIAPVRWTAREFVLIDSHVGAHLHETLERWPLQG
jgi:2'-5' RNA ligase